MFLFVLMNKKIIEAGGGLVVNEINEILFIYRRGFWDLPKGKQDMGETIDACAIREVKEETGLKELQIENFICETFHEYFDKWENEFVTKKTTWFLMKSSKSQKINVQLEEDITKAIWANEEDIEVYLKKTFQTIKDVIENYNKLKTI